MEENWTTIKQTLKDKNGDNTHLHGFLDATKFVFSSLNQNDSYQICLGVPSVFHKKWLLKNFLTQISNELSNHYKKPCQIDVEILTDTQKKALKSESVPKIPLEQTPLEQKNTESKNQNPLMKTVNKKKSNSNYETLNPKYSFSKFVVGPNSEFAHAVSYSVSRNPGTEKNYNPLFIFGPTGMGKTHLLNAVGNQIRETHPHLKCMYISAENFINECVHHIRHQKMEKFHQKFRNTYDVLLMDDIQILARGESTQEEFFNTLNHFFNDQKQVVVASDQMPKDLSGLEDRIQSRLEWGVIADIQMPDIETRIAILRSKAKEMQLNLIEDVIYYIARISKRSIRELEGNLNKIKMYSELQGLEITLDTCKKIFKNHEDQSMITTEEIQKMVAHHYKIRVLDLKSKVRKKHIVLARQVAMYLIKTYLEKSLTDIGRAFGGRDHSTVISSLTKITNQQAKDFDLKKDIKNLETKIRRRTGV